MKRTLTVLSALAGLLVLLLSLGAVPASATEAQGFVGGGGVVTDDWGDEGTLSQTRNAVSGATVLWQRVLYADGLIGDADIDGDFGPHTAAATRTWQSRHSVGVDGVVGPQTFGAADGHLSLFKSFNKPGLEDLEIHYVGSVHTISMARINGEYRFVAGPSGAVVGGA
ncbi:MAG TPA: peptidoglycan-binding domain-containing protein, partial [Mycobacteriales bacterium]|nr:peptidoglycan-binding domain-containing protein [Mycobacteriales bacterium]